MERFGQKLPYDSSWTGPWSSNVERKPRDPLLLVVFMVYFIAWLITGLFVIGLAADVKGVRLRIYTFSNTRDGNINTKIWFFGVPIVIVCTVITIVLSFLWVFIASKKARVITWFSLIFFMFLCIIGTFGGAFLYDLYDPKYSLAKTDKEKKKEKLYIQSAWLICGVMAMIIICCMVFFKKRIDVAAELIKEACKATLNFPGLFALSIVVFILIIIVTVFSLLYIGSIFVLYGVAIPEEKFYLGNLFPLVFLSFFVLVGLAWTGFFISYMFQMITYGSIATWYWTKDKSNLDVNATRKSFDATIRYHLGSIAMGSLILSIVSIIRSLTEGLLEDNNAGVCFAFIRVITNTYFRLLEEAIVYFNEKAYVTCIVHGTDFFDSAKFTFQLIARNPLFAFVQNFVTELVLVMAILFTVLVPFIICLLLTWPLIALDANYFWIAGVSVITGIIASYIIFMIVKHAITAIFVSALEDWERNDGSHMTQDLRFIMMDAGL